MLSTVYMRCSVAPLVVLWALSRCCLPHRRRRCPHCCWPWGELDRSLPAASGLAQASGGVSPLARRDAALERLQSTQTPKKETTERTRETATTRPARSHHRRRRSERCDGLPRSSTGRCDQSRVQEEEREAHDATISQRNSSLHERSQNTAKRKKHCDCCRCSSTLPSVCTEHADASRVL